MNNPQLLLSFSHWMIAGGLILTALGGLGTYYYGKQVEKSDKAAAVVAEQRPWVNVDFEIMTPLSCDDKGWDAGKRWHIAIRYHLENVGKTPATQASFIAKMVPLVISHLQDSAEKKELSQNPIVFGTDVAKEFDALCKSQEQLIKHNMGFGQVLFPGNDRSVKFVLNGNSKIFDEIKKNPSGYSGHFLIIVCATYGSTYNDKLFHTAKAFQIFKRSGNKFIDPNGETIPMEDLAIVPHPIQGSRAE